ncbi:head GIN domain-containing protein [Winogradskyella sp.]|uniref:head GIN domain-containing protein n=1 Tax=Winogradskyella sp. TaxID=1883156 RepID=UPI0025F7BCDD|nr:head GIN domain-containing protein [Winogradskyella sp.]
MKNLKCITIVVLVLFGQTLLAQTKKIVEPFNKVIISPHIETTFVQGDEESVTILANTLSDDIVNIEVKGETLRVYLDDAKETTKHKKVIIDGVKRKVPIYKNKVLTIVVTYKNIDELSLRGEQRTVCESLINVKEFRLKIYGESQVTFNAVNFKEFDADIYGESRLTVKEGNINNQKITAYGEGDINLVEVSNKASKLKAYGEAKFTVNASERIKFTAYGEAELYYKGTAEVDRGLSIGDSKVNRI